MCNKQSALECMICVCRYTMPRQTHFKLFDFRLTCKTSKQDTKKYTANLWQAESKMNVEGVTSNCYSPLWMRHDGNNYFRLVELYLLFIQLLEYIFISWKNCDLCNILYLCDFSCLTNKKSNQTNFKMASQEMLFQLIEELFNQIVPCTYM